MKKQPSFHVGLNAHLLSRQSGYRSAGIHNYIQQLIQHLPDADAHLRMTVLAGHHRHTASDAVKWRASRWPTERPWARIAWEQLAQPWALYRAGVQLLHAMAFVSPLMSPVPTVITIHDLSFLRFPDRFRPPQRLYLSTMTRLSCRRARRVICVSQATADETVQLLGIPRARIDVVPHGVQHARFCPLPTEQVERFRSVKGLPQRFILFVGTLEPRKNLTTLVEAFHQSKLFRQGVKLVIAGGKGWYYQQVFQRVEALNLTDDVIFPGFVPDADLPLWYNTATLFVYPSIYEGFGMPLLEAMACGTPVIGSDVSCMPEVVEQAGFLVPPHSPSILAEHMARLLTEDDLRMELGQRGQVRAGAFTWEATARNTVNSYRHALTI